MTEQSSFTRLVPGFEFMQGLVKNAGAAIPGIGQWVAPTIDPAEIEKRIKELRTVQFWLEQNARMLAATIQALEVQHMTLSTLKTMNVQMEGLRDALKVPVPAAAKAAESPEVETQPEAETDAAAPPAPAGVVDPMQWWSALTKQFGHLATAAMQDGVAMPGTSTNALSTTKRTAIKKATPKKSTVKKATRKKTSAKADTKKVAPRP